ncbi:ATP-binding protein [Kibdelosporangium persicum]|uniref:Anti-sigma regulatory factor (Ser/Thr protein kinase) n=1 Tax=Kibdelosporangium persicum TaxID=2698649 RepID=A0ABX2FID3_9PSEU|nr:ATP-binding protein [Kibdelosporangium persicum]NRN70622.1 Anti-sigma regulatory factor (Ser/Thr protein kinase) [Kibdelosporangium persicum]
MQRHEHGGPLPAPLRAWAATLPDLAGDVVTDADLSEPYLHLSAPATPSQLAPIRDRVLEWTYAVRLLEDERQDIVMATDEAVSNAVRHAYHHESGMVTVFAACDRLARAVHVVVSDDGTWSAPSGTGNGGRGLEMMDALSDVFDLHHDARGTTVVLRWARRANA